MTNSVALLTTCIKDDDTFVKSSTFLLLSNLNGIAHYKKSK